MNKKLWGLSAFQMIMSIESQPLLIEDSWSPDVHVMTARQQKDLLNGFYLEAKGGHNGESLNHKDVGHFIMYYNGNPVFVDGVVGVYNRDTFGTNR